MSIGLALDDMILYWSRGNRMWRDLDGRFINSALQDVMKA